MKIEKRSTDTYVLTDIDRLHPVTVYVTNYNSGKGKIVIECYGDAWVNYWGAMGDRNLQEFFISCDNGYILNNLLKETQETDYDEIEKITGGEVCVSTEFELAMAFDTLREILGQDWYMDIPRCATSEYNYLGRIVDAIKIAFREEIDLKEKLRA